MALVVEGAEHWNIRFGQKQANQDCQEVTLQIEDEKLAVLYWQAGFPVLTHGPCAILHRF